MSDAPPTRTDLLTPPPSNGRTADIEALTAALAEARWQQTLLASIVAQAPIGVFVADAKTGLPQLVNQTGIDLLGRGFDPHRRKDEAAEVYPNYLPGTQQPYPVQDLPLVRTMASGQAARAEMDIQRPVGRVRVEMTTTPIRDAAGRVVSAVALVQPVVQRPTEAAALEESETIFRRALEAAGAVPYRRDHLSNTYTYMGDGLRALTGYGPDEMTPHLFESLIQETIPVGPANTGRSERRITTRDGQTRWLSDASIEIQDATGAVTGSIGILQDITERTQHAAALAQRAAELSNDLTEWKQTELALRDAEARTRLIVDTALDALISMDGGGFITSWNPQAENIFGWASQDVVGKRMADVIVPNQYRAAHERGLKHFLATGEGPVLNKRIEITALHRDGHEFPVELAISPVKVGGTFTFSAFVRDITDRKQAEAALAKRANELEVVAQVGVAAATILEPSQLLQTVVDLTKSSFKLYHAHVYLLNETGDTLELAAGAGEVGHKMVSQGWRIPSNREQSLVARAARTRQGVIVNDVRNAPDFLPNPLLPDTRSEMALPVVAGDRILGVLDVQADEPDHFTEEDLRIQSILATQIAVALQNARQFTEARRLADRETMVNAISQQIQSAATVESALQIAARELGRALGAQRTVVQLGQPNNSPR